MTSRPVLTFWYEFASTYSYPAAMRIDDMARAAGVDVIWRPFLLGPVALQQQGWTDSIFNTIPAKGRYMWRDLERICAAEGLAFNRPPIFPQNTLLATRIAHLGEAEAWIAPFSRAVYEANFAHGHDISDPDVLSRILHRFGLNAGEVISRAQDRRNKDSLKARSEEALAHDIFGAPSFVAKGELFWGFDRLPQALAWALKD